MSRKSLESRSLDIVIKNFKDAASLGLSLPNKLWSNVIDHWQGMQATQITHVYYSTWSDMLRNDVIAQQLALSFNDDNDIEEYMEESSDETNRILLKGLVALPGVYGALSEYTPSDIYYTYHQLVDGAYRDDTGSYYNIVGDKVDERINPMVKDAISRKVESGDYSQTGVLTVDQGNTVIEQRALERLGASEFTYQVIPYYGNNVILHVICE